MGVAVHIFNVRAQQNREMFMIRQVAPHLRDDRPIVLKHDRQARAREQFGRLFSAPSTQHPAPDSNVQR